MKTKKILYLITKSNFGGAQRYVLDLALAAKQKGYTVAVAFGGTGAENAPPGALETRLKEHGIRTIQVQNFMRDVSALKDIRAVFELIGLFFREKPDILHTNSSKAGGLGAFAGRVCGIKKIVFTSHGLTFNESWRPGWQRLIIKYGTWLTMLLTHTSIMISNETYELARHMPLLKQKVERIHNGIHAFEPMDQTAAQKALHLEYVPHDAFILGTIAELHPNKNLGAVLDALGQTESDPAVHFAIMGTGELAEKLKEKAADSDLTGRVHFLGFVEDAHRYLSAFDAFILPSFKEGLPFVLLEAGMAKLPVIASNISGNTDIIEDGQNGLLIDPTRPSTIAAAIEKLAKDASYRGNLAKQLHSTVQTQFATKRMIDATFDVYER